MIKMIAYELRFVLVYLSIINEVGVNLKLCDIESLNFVLSGLHILPIEDFLLEKVVEGVTQFNTEVTRGR
jgi:hypothetical protein